MPRRKEDRRIIDSTDERLLDALRRDPRATNKALALELGLTEVAVAARIRALDGDNVFRVVAQLDFRALDYDILAILDIQVRNGKIKAVAEALSAIEGVGSVSILVGDPPIIVQVQARGLDGLRDLVMREVSSIEGVERVETNIIAQIAKWTLGSGQLEPRSLFDADDEA